MNKLPIQECDAFQLGHAPSQIQYIETKHHIFVRKWKVHNRHCCFYGQIHTTRNLLQADSDYGVHLAKKDPIQIIFLENGIVNKLFALHFEGKGKDK